MKRRADRWPLRSASGLWRRRPSRKRPTRSAVGLIQTLSGPGGGARPAGARRLPARRQGARRQARRPRRRGDRRRRRAEARRRRHQGQGPHRARQGRLRRRPDLLQRRCWRSTSRSLDGGTILIIAQRRPVELRRQGAATRIFFATSYQNDQVARGAGQGRAGPRLQEGLPARARTTRPARTRSPASSATSRARSWRKSYVPLNKLDFQSELAKIAAAQARRDLHLHAGRHGREPRQAVPPGRPRRPHPVPLRLHGRRVDPAGAAGRGARLPRRHRPGRRTSTTPQNKTFVAAFEKELQLRAGLLRHAGLRRGAADRQRAEGDRRQAPTTRTRCAAAIRKADFKSAARRRSSSTPTAIRSRTSTW